MLYNNNAPSIATIFQCDIFHVFSSFPCLFCSLLWLYYTILIVSCQSLFIKKDRFISYNEIIINGRYAYPYDFFHSLYNDRNCFNLKSPYINNIVNVIVAIQIIVTYR